MVKNSMNISSNSATAGGGFVFSQNSLTDLLVINNSISHTSSIIGGGVFHITDLITLTLFNSTF